MANQKYQYDFGGTFDGGTIETLDASWSNPSGYQATFQAALDVTYGSGNTTANHISGGTWTVEFIGAMANMAVNAPIVNLTKATSGGSKLIKPSILAFYIGDSLNGDGEFSGLTGDIDATQTTFDVENGSVYPATPFYVTCESEKMRVTGISSNTLTVTRAALGTTGASHSHYVSGIGASTIATSGGIDDTQTTFNVADSSSFPATPFVAKCESEYMSVTNVSGNTFTVVRVFAVSTAASHAETVDIISVLPRPVTALTTVTDITDNHRDAQGVVSTGGSAPALTLWSSGSRLSFSTTQMTASDAGFPSGSSPFTMHCRINANSVSLSYVIGYGSTSPGGAGCGVYVNGDGSVGANFLDVGGGGGSIGAGEDHDIGVTWNGTTLATYLDGILVYSYTPSTPNVTLSSTWVGFIPGFGYHFSGLIREIWYASGVYDLTDENVRHNPSDYTTTELQAGGGGGPVSLSTSIGIASSTSADIKGLIGRAASFDIASAASADIKGLQSLSTSISIATAATGSLQKINPGGSGGGMLTLTGVG